MINYFSGTYNYEGIRMPEGGGMTAEMSPKQIKEQIQTWLMEDGWSLRQETPEQGLWAFVAEDQFGRKIVVGQRVNKEDEIVIQGAVNISDDTTDRIGRLTEDERNNLLWDLRFELVRTNLEFSGISHPLKRVEVIERLFLDVMTKDCFLQRTSEVRKGVIVVMWVLAKKFAQQPPPRQAGFQK